MTDPGGRRFGYSSIPGLLHGNGARRRASHRRAPDSRPGDATLPFQDLSRAEVVHRPWLFQSARSRVREKHDDWGMSRPDAGKNSTMGPGSFGSGRRLDKNQGHELRRYNVRSGKAPMLPKLLVRSDVQGLVVEPCCQSNSGPISGPSMKT